MEYPDNLVGYSYDDTKVEIGKDGELDIAYSKAERENVDHVKAKRFQITREANVFLRRIHTLIVPKDYYKELIQKWCNFTGHKYETACEMLNFKEET